MKSMYLYFGLLVLAVHLSDAGVTQHGAQNKLKMDGKPNPHFEHEAVLGSIKEEKEFDDLSPEEAKERLGKLAKKMDVNKDGYVTEAELENWILRSFKRLEEENARDQFKEQDANKDGHVTWKEFKDAYYDIAGTDYSEEEIKRLKAEEEVDHTKFKAADKNNDQQLSIKEYMPFHLPHHHEHMLEHEINRQLLAHDKNKDGVIHFDEYKGEATDEEDDEEEHDKNMKEEFNKYDLNKDGYLNRQEIKTMATFDDRETAKEEAKHLLTECDDNKDNKLSFDEMKDHHEDFVGSKATDVKDEL